MIPHLFYYQLMVLGLLWLFVVLSLAWPSPSGPQAPRPTIPSTSRRRRGKEPQPFGGLTHKPLCVLCDQEATHPTATASGTTRSDATDPPPPTGHRLREALLSAYGLCLPRLVGAGQPARQTAIPAVARGVNATVRPAKATFQSITAPCSMASASRSTSSYTSSVASQRAWASAGRRGFSRSIPTRCSAGSWR